MRGRMNNTTSRRPVTTNNPQIEDAARLALSAISMASAGQASPRACDDMMRRAHQALKDALHPGLTRFRFAIEVPGQVAIYPLAVKSISGHMLEIRASLDPDNMLAMHRAFAEPRSFIVKMFSTNGVESMAHGVTFKEFEGMPFSFDAQANGVALESVMLKGVSYHRIASPPAIAADQTSSSDSGPTDRQAVAK